MIIIIIIIISSSSSNNNNSRKLQARAEFLRYNQVFESRGYRQRDYVLETMATLAS